MFWDQSSLELSVTCSAQDDRLSYDSRMIEERAENGEYML